MLEMRQRLQRLWPLLFVLCALFASSRAQPQREVIFAEPDPAEKADSHRLSFDQKHGAPDDAETKSGSSKGEAMAANEKEGLVEDIKGAPLVQEALSILRTLEAPKDKQGRSDGPASLMGTLAYYGKELFYLLFMNGPPVEHSSNNQPDRESLGQPLAEAVNLLETASKDQNPDAMYLLAELNFYGNFTYPRNYHEAFRRYHDLAILTGNNSAQHMVGFMYATGIGGGVERDQAKALLYHTFAALGGNTRSEMTVAFRHHTGIGTARNCDEAAFYYKKVAVKAIEYWRSGPPGGRTLSRDAHRLADEEGGVYGEGASVSSAGINAVRGGPNSDTHAALDDVLEYLDLLSRKGDFKATFSLGKLYYEGRRSMKRNPKKAKTYFMLVAKKYWTREGKVISGSTPDLEEYASKAAAYLGRLFLTGEGMEQSFEKARTWFRRGIGNGDAIAQHGMGLLYLEGLGVPKDAMKAASYFKASADQDFGPAQVNMGALLLDQGDVQIATRYFELAMRKGNLEAYYYLAEIADQAVGRDRSCGMATAYYKIVAERAELIHSSFAEANEAYQEGDLKSALVRYMMAAEQGYEAGQANVAYLLDEEKSRLPLDTLLPLRQTRPLILRNPGLALIYWTRSAKQSNMDSMVKMGDYYLSGVGTDADDERAAACYQAAADFQQSAQALWNLGWMHENGIGVEQDFHLAKRFYDQALETNEEAYLPVSLSLLKLRVRSFWNTITNGRVNSIRDEPEPEPTRQWSFGEWINNFIQDDHPYYNDVDDDDLTSPIHDPMVDGDDFHDGAIDDGILESFIIVGLAATLAFLVYYRQQRQLNHQRATQPQNQAHGAGGAAAQQQQGQGQGAAAGAIAGNELQQPDEDRGFFPRPGDPEFGQWVAGGVVN